MLVNRVALWVFVSVTWLWSGFAAAEPLESMPEGQEEDLAGRGVVVVSIGKGSALEKAGLRQGDLIVGWERLPNPPSNPQGAHGRIEDYGDWIGLKEEQSPRGSIRLEIYRGAEPQVVEIPLSSWSIRTRPTLTDAESACLKELAGQVPNPALSCWSTVFPNGRPPKREGAFYWLGLSFVSRLDKADKTKEAREFLKTIIDQLSVIELQVPALWILGSLNASLGDIENARNAYRQAAHLVEMRQGKNLLWARCKTGLLAMSLLDHTEVLHYEELLELLALRRALAPGTAEVAGSLSNLAVIESGKGDFEAAAERYKEALEIEEKLEPGGNEVATILDNYSVALWRVGDLAKAEQMARRGLDLREQLEVGVEGVASALINLATIVSEKGDLDEAEKLLSRALSLIEPIPQLAVYKLTILDNLAEFYWKRGEYERAEALLSDAILILGKPAREDGREISLLNNLGTVEERKGDYQKARSHFLKAYQIAERLSPQGIDHWATLENLARLDVAEGRPSSSVLWSRRALSMVRVFGPSSLFEARSLMRLSDAYVLQAKYAPAEESLVRALSIIQAYPGQPIERTQVFSLLAKLHLKRGEPQRAVDFFAQAAQAAEHAASFSGGRFQDVLLYRDLLLAALDGQIGALVKAGMFQEAFRALEGKRARSFAALLRERDLRLNAGELGELTAERQLLDRKYDHLQMELWRLSESGRREDLEAATRRLHDVEARLSQVASRIKLSSPRLTSLDDMEVPEPAELRKAAPKGVLLLSFATEGDQSFVFSMASDADLRCGIIKAGRRELSDKVDRFRSLLVESSGNGQLSVLREAALRDVGGQLYRLLLEPVEDLIESHERVLVLADGPLQLLPFGALRLWRTGPSQGTEPNGIYLASWKPLRFVSSFSNARPAATAEGQPGQLAFVGFGEPSVPKKAGSSSVKAPDLEGRRDARRRGFLDENLLFHSRREVEAISSLFPSDQVKVFVGREATEETAKEVGKDSRIIHFATHAFLDDRFPLSSSVILAMPDDSGTGNGLFQVWEIFEQIRLNADLVVLSGCETALGEENGGEGLMGLARAFQYAGARSVLASLWSVNDQATSELMIRFYKHLRAGLPKDQALQAAQQEFIRGPIEVANERGEREIRDFSSPYYWAGFQLYGDWQ